MDEIQSWANWDVQIIKSREYVKNWMDDIQVSWDLNHPQSFLNWMVKIKGQAHLER
jgi:hypothetical protein